MALTPSPIQRPNRIRYNDIAKYIKKKYIYMNTKDKGQQLEFGVYWLVWWHDVMPSTSA